MTGVKAYCSVVLPSLALALTSVVGATGCTHSGSARPTRVAVLPLDGIGIPPGQKARLDRTIRRQIREAAQVPVVEPSEAAQRPASLKACGARADQREARCATEVGRALDASHVVFGAAGRLGETWMLRLKLLRVREARVVRAVEETLFAPDTSIDQSMQQVATRLFDLPKPRPWYTQWWTWTVAGVAVSAAVILPIVLTRDTDDDYRDIPFP